LEEGRVFFAKIVKEPSKVTNKIDLRALIGHEQLKIKNSSITHYSILPFKYCSIVVLQTWNIV